MAIIDSYLSYLLEVEGTDLLLAAGARPMMRLNGQLQVMKRRYVAASDVEYHALEVLGQERMNRLPELKSMDFIYEASINGADRRFRGSVYLQRNGLNIVLRVVPAHIPTLSELGLPPALASLTESPGLVVVAGPGRNGKSSTLAALVEHVNAQRPVHVVTVEDPIEWVHPARKALISQRQIGLHAESFGAALEGVLREDPDVVMVSDLRDLESIRLALRAAESGHVVLAGMRTWSAVRTVEALVHAFPENEKVGARNQVARFLKAVVALQLVPRADGSGQVPVADVLVSTPRAASLIRSGSLHALVDVIRTGDQGMRLMEDDLATLAAEGVIHEDMANSRIEACELARVGGTS